METKDTKLIAIIFILSFVFVMSLFMNIVFIYGICKQRTPINIIDTTYNTVVLDSIKTNIIKKDSIITKYKIEYEYEIEKISNDTDSAAVNRFYELVSR